MRNGTCSVALIAFLAGGCLPAGPAEHPSEEVGRRLRRRIGKVLEAGIRAYNDGKIVRAREQLESVLRGTKDSSLAYIRAAAHFYLAAVAWDLGEKDRTTHHLKLCRHVDPAYAPDWTFISPGLREHFGSFK